MVRVGENYLRDTDSMGLSNINSMEKEEYYAKARFAKSQREELNSVKEEVKNIKEEVTEIKEILKLLLERK